MKTNWIDNVLKFVLILLIAICIFDPSDQLLGQKVPLFILVWIIFMFSIVSKNKPVQMPIGMISYLLLFTFIIPLTSILYYFLINGDIINYDGLNYFKSYLFLTIVIILVVSNIDLLKPTVLMISIISVLTIILFVISMYDAAYVNFLHTAVGERFNMFDLGTRYYGDFVFPVVHFHTSPLILFSLGYFTLAFINSKRLKKSLYGLLIAINIAGMFLGGTRNNILLSILVPMIIGFWYLKDKSIFIYIIIVSTIVILSVNYADLFRAMVDPNDPSNVYKLSFYEDYLNLFTDMKVLCFGQGLGSYFYTTMRGYVSVTELTYFEFIRRFGLILSLPTFALLLYPLYKLRLKKYHSVHYIFIAYACYLIGSFFQPFLMSSSGMLILSLILYNTFGSTARTQNTV